NRKDEIDLAYTDDELIAAGRPYLPDHLVRRRVIANQRVDVSEPESSFSGDWISAKSHWSGYEHKSMVSGAELSWEQLAQLGKDFRIERAEVVGDRAVGSAGSLEMVLIPPCIELANKSYFEFKDILDEVVVAVYAAEQSPRTVVDSLISEASINTKGRRFKCLVFSNEDEVNSDARYVFKVRSRGAYGSTIEMAGGSR